MQVTLSCRSPPEGRRKVHQNAHQITTHRKQLSSGAPRGKTALCLSAALSLALLPSLANAQAAPAPQPAPETQATPVPAPPDQNPNFHTTVNEVSLDLAVHDRRHRPVLDIKPSDLAITDDGTPVKLTGLHLVTAEAAATRGHLITLIFDPFHGPMAKNTQIVAGKILKVLPASGYSFAVLDFSNRIRLLHGFTTDRQALAQTIQVATESRPKYLSSTLSQAVNFVIDKEADEERTKVAAEAEKNLVAVAQTGIDLAGHPIDVKDRAAAQTLVKALQDTPTIEQEQHAQLNLAGLLAVVRSQQHIPERKVLIYFTRNQQLDPAAKKMLATIAGAAALAGVTIYTIDMDAIGNSTQYQEPNALLNAQPPFNPAPVATSPYTIVIPMQQEAGTPIAGDPSPTGPVWGPRQDIEVMTDFMRSSGEDRTNPFADTKNPMAALSKNTGGEYIDARNNIKKPLDQMAEDLATYYLASYIPPFKDYDGKFRTISVKALRRGLSIDTKKGYFALAPGAESGIQPFEAPLLKALAQPHLPVALRFHAAVLRFGDLPDGNSNSIAVEVPLAELETKKDARTGLSSAQVAIVVRIKDKSGTVIEHFSQDISPDGVAQTLQHDPSATVSFERHFFSVPGTYTMEVAVLDRNSGKAGAERRSFQIPNLNGAVSLSDMVLVRSLAGAHEEEEDPLEPLRYGHQKVTPNLTGTVPADTRNVSLFFILHPDPDSSAPMKLEMQLVHDGVAAPRKPLLGADGLQSPVPYLASIKSRSLPPGEYQVRAFLTQGGKTSEQSDTFILPGTPRKRAASSRWFQDADIGPDLSGQPIQGVPHPSVQLAITPPARPLPPLTVSQARAMIEEARQNALDYNSRLPDFSCTEVTHRFVDIHGEGKWRPIDSLVELLLYQDRQESRTTLEVNGQPSNVERSSLKGVLSAGEFGGVLQAVFHPSAKADFQWKGTDAIRRGTVQVFDYRVDRANSMFSVTASNGKQLIVGFHGQVFIDSATRRARRVTLIADDLPPAFPTHSTSIRVDYDYVPILNLNYLMPVSAELKLARGKGELLMNTMEFTEYKRTGPETRETRASAGLH